MVSVEKLIADTCDLPTIPTVALKVMELMEEESTSAADLKRVIEVDPALAARVLKISNSALYGCRGSVTSLPTAIMVMGFDTLKSVVIAASTRSIYKRFGLTEKFLWEHSLVNGLASRAIAAKVGLGKLDEAFVAGLLHDIGKVVIDNSAPAQYQMLVSKVFCEGLDFEDAERAMFGFSHVDVGAMVAKKWKLSEELEAVITCHHDFTRQSDPYLAKLAAAVNLANGVSRLLGVGGEFQGGVHLDRLESFDYLALTRDGLNDMIDEVQESYRNEKTVLC